MSDSGKFPPGHGYAWRGDWKSRLLDLVRSRGYSCVSEYADAHPLRSLLELAEEPVAAKAAAWFDEMD